MQKSSSTNVPYTQVPANYSVKLLKASWLLAKRNYGLFLAVAITQALPVIFTSKIPYIGAIASPLLATLLGIGGLIIGRKTVSGEAVRYNDLFIAFTDRGILKKLAPFILIMLMLALINHMLAGAMVVNFKNFQGDPFGMLYVFLGYIFLFLLVCLITYFTWFVSPLIVFKNLSTMDAINDSVAVIAKEWWMFTVLGLWTSLYIFVCALFFVLPILFIYLPGMVCFSYLVYAAYFENLDIELYHEKLRSLPT